MESKKKSRTSQYQPSSSSKSQRTLHSSSPSESQPSSSSKSQRILHSSSPSESRLALLLVVIKHRESHSLHQKNHKCIMIPLAESLLGRRVRSTIREICQQEGFELQVDFELTITDANSLLSSRNEMMKFLASERRLTLPEVLGPKSGWNLLGTMRLKRNEITFLDLSPNIFKLTNAIAFIRYAESSVEATKFQCSHEGKLALPIPVLGRETNAITSVSETGKLLSTTSSQPMNSLYHFMTESGASIYYSRGLCRLLQCIHGMSAELTGYASIAKPDILNNLFDYDTYYSSPTLKICHEQGVTCDLLKYKSALAQISHPREDGFINRAVGFRLGRNYLMTCLHVCAILQRGSKSWKIVDQMTVKFPFLETCKEPFTISKTQLRYPSLRNDNTVELGDDIAIFEISPDENFIPFPQNKPRFYNPNDFRDHKVWQSAHILTFHYLQAEEDDSSVRNSISIQSGHIAGFSGIEFYYTIDTRGGWSGSPIFNHNGQLLGIHRAQGHPKFHERCALFNAGVRIDLWQYYRFALHTRDGQPAAPTRKLSRKKFKPIYRSLIQE